MFIAIEYQEKGGKPQFYPKAFYESAKFLGTSRAHTILMEYFPEIFKYKFLEIGTATAAAQGLEPCPQTAAYFGGEFHTIHRQPYALRVSNCRARIVELKAQNMATQTSLL